MEKIRLQKYLADAGIMSRRAAEQEIIDGNVSINGHVAELGAKVDPRNDVIAYRGKRIRYEKKGIHIHNDEQAQRLSLHNNR